MHDLDRSFLELDPTHAVASEFWSAPSTPVSREMVATAAGAPSPFAREVAQAVTGAPSPFAHEVAAAAGGAPSPFAREVASAVAGAPAPFARELTRTQNQEVFDEMTEMELAAELLGAQSDQEMEFFLGGLLSKVGGFLGKALNSDVGRGILGGLKGLAKTAFPVAGPLLDAVVPGELGGTGSRSLGEGAGRALGLELEGMSPADQEFEVARRVVRLGAQAARHAAGMTPATQAEAVRVAQTALAAAAREVAPGLLRQAPATVHGNGNGRAPAFTANPGERRTGRWVRQGDRILLLGV
jgi:hypothetical protein